MTLVKKETRKWLRSLNYFGLPKGLHLDGYLKALNFHCAIGVKSNKSMDVE